MIKKENFLKWFNALPEVYHQEKEFLCTLDLADGDGDHGDNIHKIFVLVAEVLQKDSGMGLRGLFKKVSETLINSDMGLQGKLYGEFFLTLSVEVTGEDSIEFLDFVKAMGQAVLSVSESGGCSRGDKTMLDVLFPVVDCLNASVVEGLTTCESMKQASQVAKASIDNTISMTFKNRNSAGTGIKTNDHIDPGAYSASLMIGALRDAFISGP